MFDSEPDAAITDAVKNMLVGKGDIQAGPINAFLDNDTAGLFSGGKTQGTRLVTCVMGANAAPVAGDAAFSWEFEDVGYMVEPGTGFVAANLPLGGASYSSTVTYCKPWGVLIHPSGAETGANTSTGVDDYGASPPSLGGIFWYHLFSSNGTLTLSLDEADSNDNPSFGALSGATSGSIDASSSPAYDMVALSTSAAVKRYLRWQLALDTATTCTFACGFIRNTFAR